MVKVVCHTNLDIYESWPDKLSCRPVKGDIIEAGSAMPNRPGKLELEVVRIVHRSSGLLEVELHLPSGRFRSIASFLKWYRGE